MTKRIASVIHVAVAIAALLYCTLRAQKVYSVKYRDRSDVTVYVTDYPSQADLLVYRVKYRDRAGDKDGWWYFTKYPDRADKKIFFEKYSSRADLKIHFVQYKSSAKWRRQQKQYLLQ